MHKTDLIVTAGSADNGEVGIFQTVGPRPQQEDYILIASTPSTTIPNIPAAMERAFAATSEHIGDVREEGSTATVAVLTPDNQLTLAHLGDSPAILFVRDQKTGKVHAEELIKPHNLSNPAEKKRVAAAGAEVRFDVLPYKTVTGKTMGLSMTRGFGDKQAAGISDQPEITSIDLSKRVENGEQAFLLLASDGVTRKIGKPEDASERYVPSLEEMARVVEASYKEHSTTPEQSTAKKLAEAGDNIGIKDNRTALFVDLSKPRQNTMVLGVCDGHGGPEVAKQAAEKLKTILPQELERAQSASIRPPEPRPSFLARLFHSRTVQPRRIGG